MDQALAHVLAEVKAKREAIACDLESVFIAEGMTPTCRKGCSACCYWPFSVSVLEAALVLECSIEEHKWTTARREVVQRTAGLTTGLAFDVWLHGRIPCPFLVDGFCEVYKARPLSCRVTRTTEDPSGCSTIGPANTLRKTEILMSYHTHEEQVLRRLGLKLYTMPLATAISVAAQIYNKGLSLDQLEIAILSEHQSKL